MTKHVQALSRRCMLVFVCGCILCFIITPGRTQTAKLSGIAHIAFRVDDLNASRSFYQRLGFEQAFELSKQTKPTQAFIKINDNQFIELYARSTPSQQIGFMHICFESNNLTELNEEYLKRGLHPTPVKRAAAGNLLFTLQGPEGQIIEFTQYMPGSRHVKDRGKHLGANRISKSLMGVSLVMQNTAAAKTFYTGSLGFKAMGNGNFIHLGLPGDMRETIELESRAQYKKPQLLFVVNNIREITEVLHQRGFSVKSGPGAASITDPDGTVITLLSVPESK